MEVSKSEFAALINVSPGRVSQFIASGQISRAAIIGSGQRAKIDVERAKADLRLSLDVSQRLGNGIDTRLDDDDDGGNTPELGKPGRKDLDDDPFQRRGGVDFEIKQQKLEQIRRVNRNAAIEDAKSAGTLIETDASRSAMVKVASSMLLVFEGGLTDFATAIAEEFKVPHRDVLHLLRREFRKVRANGAKQVKSEAVTLPETMETTLEVEEIETLN
ncbi:hypothetical protein [Agrobacterium tumefaciens]|uniref:hypothetical protein n=1 Tax=Agrobacterium tumefaciens TaxID=358 RepID=UPI0021CE6E02|nr:hypothetical protein [Agrobacterium tumefaciens]UXS04459.1 hypothetical protein FY156_23635 [Agrobacterium tumefaciens]